MSENKPQQDESAQGAVGSNDRLGWGNFRGLPQMPIPLQERIKLARKHMARHSLDCRGQMVWPYQEFAMSIGELLDAAERAA